jgi:hypothetical protein
MKGSCIDDGYQRAITKEREKWRRILRVIIDAFLFCAKKLFGSTWYEVNGKRDCGNFLSTTELISCYDKTIREQLKITKKAL